MSKHITRWFVTALARVDELKREEGQALVEYALILALVAVASIVILGQLSTAVNNEFQAVIDAL